MPLPLDVTDPGDVNVADQGFGTGLATQVVGNTAVTQAASTISASTPVAGGTGKPGTGTASDVNNGDTVPEQPSATKTPGVIEGGSASPVRLPFTNVTVPGSTDVAAQRYGTGSPANVFV